MKKIKPKKALLNIPIILTFEDYHEITYMKEYLNEICVQRIRSKELEYSGGYNAVFYFKQDEEFKSLLKEFKKINEEEFDE